MEKSREEMALIHKERCRELKLVRAKMAEELGVNLHQRECTYEGYCSGTCPKCAAEERALNEALLRRQEAEQEWEAERRREAEQEEEQEVERRREGGRSRRQSAAGSRVLAAGLAAIVSLGLSGCMSSAGGAVELEGDTVTFDGGIECVTELTEVEETPDTEYVTEPTEEEETPDTEVMFTELEGDVLPDEPEE